MFKRSSGYVKLEEMVHETETVGIEILDTCINISRSHTSRVLIYFQGIDSRIASLKYEAHSLVDD
ncbi:CIC11C00000003140 [Sungouiella intermedia]|uniref:CIC11C00000003140 n=1 Tax=Sungouiella intermedia TaxID=45354 RepID=A0A1L0BKE4_9ASCO|nr:CIC11C00000003140 [[Candida] intermedia]